MNSRLEKLKECLEKLKPLSKVSKKEFLSTSGFQDIAERNLQVAIQCLLDMGNHLIAALGLRRPEDYEETFIILSEEGVLPKKFALKIAPMAGLRNILIHEYLKVDLEKIYEHLQNLKDFEKFAQTIIVFVEKETHPLPPREG